MADFNVRLLAEKYKKFVIENPLVASELEVALRWISYFAAGRFSQTIVISELMHSASNLLTFLNDMILRKAANISVHTNAVIERLQVALSVIDYIEVFAEITASRLGGAKTRWLIIVTLQLIKTVIRLFLILKFKQGVQKSPSILPLNRSIDVPQFCSPRNHSSAPGSSYGANMEVSFTLKRSGRVIRTLEAAPPLCGRTWKLPKLETTSQLRNCVPTLLTEKQTVGEVMHITRPLAHLLSMSIFGTQSWKPYILSFIMDYASLYLIKTRTNLNHSEKLELSRRSLHLLLYLLRSPMYDQASEVPILYVLNWLATNIRGLGLLMRPAIEYLPEWQKSYSYTWSV